eukprot:TRINITY_DN9634_c0_g1_i1.p1 TRINITY_DN9634_c0_g1~~TRINITY_DN9634_c0_g1_i1.p1  ORF type:complete len:485 (-),score=63.57 TRINITY_DN9634_c0_g1_i1:65-1519(-)
MEGVDTPRNDMQDATAQQIEENYWWFSIIFAVNHGTVTTPLVVASSLLRSPDGSTRIANIGNGILNISSCLSALLLGSMVIGVLGPKRGLIFGMSLYTIYVACFTAAIVVRDHDATLTMLCWYFGCSCGGVAAGVLWTAQGSYFAVMSTALATKSGETREDCNSRLASRFAIVYLTSEVATKMVFSGLQAIQVPVLWIGIVYTVLAVISTITINRVYDVSEVNVSQSVPLLGAVALWTNPLVWLLSPTNLSFGFCAAFMNGYVNSHFVSRDKVGLFAALTVVVAAIVARVAGILSCSVGKGPILIFGAVCFFSIPCMLLFLENTLGVLTACGGHHSEGGCPSGMGWAILFLYVLQGSGRAVFESTNRAVFSDFFPGAQRDGAFANCTLQSCLAFAASFFLQATPSSGSKLEIVIIALSALTFITYPVAKAIANAEPQPLLPNSEKPQKWASNPKSNVTYGVALQTGQQAESNQRAVPIEPRAAA